MADTAEEMAAKLLIPVAAVAVVVFFIQKILGWVWNSISPYAVPILWVAGLLCVASLILFVLFMRVGMNRAGLKALVFGLQSAVVFGIVVYGGRCDNLSWAKNVVDSLQCALEHPLVACIVLAVILLFAIVMPIPGLGASRSSINKAFRQGRDDGAGVRSSTDDSKGH